MSLNFFDKLWDRLLELFGEQIAKAAQHAVHSLLILILAALVIWLLKRVIRRLETRIEHSRGIVYRRKIGTVTSLIGSTIKYVVYIGAALAILSMWGLVDPTSLAFGSAAVGAAIGFGSQGLVQDVITGLSILAEDQLTVGDYVEIGGKAGVVEEIGLRVIKLRDYLGVQHIIFNRNIAQVSNYSAGVVQAIVDVSLENTEAGPAAKDVAERVCKDIANEVPFFPQVPAVEGVLQSTTKDVFLRIKLFVLPQQDAAINTLFVERLRRAFAAHQINIPDGRVRVVILSDLFRKAISKNTVIIPRPEKV
ncbi:MAG TPA: mechanosensitive ion channel domain-containing protein [Planctomycetota bacterium]|jgi:small conductance mechanosensitive channel